VYNENFLQWKIDKKYRAIFTSCFWQYSLNHSVPLKKIIEKMQAVIEKDGIFCAEYMMPTENKHVLIEHYTEEGQLANCFPNLNWEIMECFYTEEFNEEAHIGNLNDHRHRMGFFMAKKLA
jgi:hypothetical protein